MYRGVQLNCQVNIMVNLESSTYLYAAPYSVIVQYSTLYNQNEMVFSLYTIEK
jgi:hypothetical protein